MMRASAAVLLLMLAIGAAACPGGQAPMAVKGAACRTDADCVPATCCHPTACVTRAAAPDCHGVACTMHCAPGTMDCGGHCECDAGRCVARLPGSAP
jgi:hypothetical protein